MGSFGGFDIPKFHFSKKDRECDVMPQLSLGFLKRPSVQSFSPAAAFPYIFIHDTVSAPTK
jgi:hypothetical protein